mmetsp:Transcript_22710/g.49290  ORF Transcript_22710/g.49290 Transcript_22710/m.49290 type:complete len:91 (-) Transcript_22710:98-370(-)
MSPRPHFLEICPVHAPGTIVTLQNAERNETRTESSRKRIRQREVIECKFGQTSFGLILSIHVGSKQHGILFNQRDRRHPSKMDPRRGQHE